MTRPPRSRKEPLFSRRTIILSLLQGFAVLAVTLFIYRFAMNRGASDLEARSLTFITLVFANLGLILSNRFWSRNVISSLRYKNTALYVIVIGTMLLLNLVIFIPALRDLFDFGTMHPSDLFICFCAGGVCVAWFELVKLLGRPKGKTAHK
jgi:Ca2+-transporting ATPase